MTHFTRLSHPFEIKLVFSIPPYRPTPNIAPSCNAAPTDPLPVVRYDAKAGERSLDVMRWGLGAVLGEGHQVGFSSSGKVRPRTAVRRVLANRSHIDPGLTFKTERR
jgi:putative SOS response-associated peptidase YedK